MTYKVNQKIKWKWLGRFIEGSVKEVYLEPVTKTIKGKKIKRNGSPEKPAYLVESVAGNLALKLHSELMPDSPAKKQSSKIKPTMF